MTDFGFQLLALLAAVNPAAAALSAGGRAGVKQGLQAFALAIALFLLAVVGASAFIDWLEVAPESLRTAAGIVMWITGGAMIWRPPRPAPTAQGTAAGAIPLGWPSIANAGALVVATSFAADGSNLQVIAAAGIAAAVAGGLTVALPSTSRTRVVIEGAARLTGALLIVFATALIVSGVRDI